LGIVKQTKFYAKHLNDRGKRPILPQEVALYAHFGE
jgi:hypothetical protein